MQNTALYERLGFGTIPREAVADHAHGADEAAHRPARAGLGQLSVEEEDARDAGCYSYVNTSSPPTAISAWRRKSGSWGFPLSVTDFTHRPLA